MVTIGDLFEIGAGKAMSPSARLGEKKYPFLRTANVFWGRVDLSTLDAMNFSEDEIKFKSLKKGDLLVCEGGDIGRSAIWQGQLGNCGFQNHIHRLRRKSDEIIPAFFMYFLQAGFTQLGIYEGAGNKTTIPNLSHGRLAVLEVPKPPKPEQEKIAAVLWKVQRAIEVEKKLIAIARELKQSTMRQLFNHGLSGEPQKETEIGLIPKSWELKPFDEFATLQRGQDLIKSDFRGGSIPVIGATRIIGYHNVANVNGPGVTVVRSGSSAGKPLYIEQDFWAHNVVLYVKNFHGNVPLFVYYKLCTLELHQFRSGVAVPTLNRNTFSGETLAVPEIEEQNKIASVLQTLDRKISVHERKRAGLSALFQSLLHQLMTAQIRVDKLDIDTSEVTALNPPS